MNLIIFPGGGNHDEAATIRTNDALRRRIRDFGYSEMDSSLQWPGGRVTPDRPETPLTVPGSLAEAKTLLTRYEQLGKPCDIFARSFGATIAMMVAAAGSFQNLRRVILWGPIPYWLSWRMFSRDLIAGKEKYAAMGLFPDKTFFMDLYPIEVLLAETSRWVIVAGGSEDVYCPPAYLDYLRQVAAQAPGRVEIRAPIAGAPHGITEFFNSEGALATQFLKTVFG